MLASLPESLSSLDEGWLIVYVGDAGQQVSLFVVVGVGPKVAKVFLVQV
jgi:hypothetical protein